MKSILFVDQDRDVCALAGEAGETLSDCHLEVYPTLARAEAAAGVSDPAVAVVDGMFGEKELLFFLERMHGRFPDLPIVVLVPEVDLIVEPGFIEDLKRRGARVMAKTEVFGTGEKLLDFFQSFR
ncbi:MAG: hypothetical protein WC352_04105 [Candidatus Omnitrophota bacterium]|jgi:hypothetical protein